MRDGVTRLKGKIRRAEPKDTEELLEFFKLVLEDTFRSNGITDEAEMEDELEEKKQSLTEDFNSNGMDRCYLLAVLEGQIAGTIASGPPSSLILRLTDGGLKDLPELTTVFTHPDFRNQGIATSLLFVMLRKLEKDAVEEVCFDSGYRIAQCVWESLFGAPFHVEKGYWSPYNDHMIWRIQVAEAVHLMKEHLDRRSELADWNEDSSC